MDMQITATAIERASKRIAQTMIEHSAEFNRLDAIGGDGDMGTSLAAIGRTILADSAPFPQDIGACFSRLASSIAKTSGSSLSAVLMTGLMAAAKQTKGQPDLPLHTIPDLIESALLVMQARSKASLGDKTILDGLAAIALATRIPTAETAFSEVALCAASDALEEFRDRPVTIGRMRLAKDGGAGHDDPGLVALKLAIESMAQ